MRLPGFGVIGACACALLAACAALPAAATLPPPTASLPQIDFVVVGDTGYVSQGSRRSGLLPVSAAMRNYCVRARCRFGLIAGDNIYERGAAGDAADEQLFVSRFTEPFGAFAALSPDFRFYVALGNHDWRTSRAGALAQVRFLESTPPFHMNGPFYRSRPAGLAGEVEIFVLDTEMLLAPLALPDMEATEAGLVIASGGTVEGGTDNARPTNSNERAQLAWLEHALASSDARWKLVMGHHPLWQSRADEKYAQSIALRRILLPALCRYADAYLAGHQHTLELHTDSCTGGPSEGSTIPLPGIVSGAGAKLRTVNEQFQAWQQESWPQLRQIWAAGGVHGFAHVTLAGRQMEVRMLIVAEDSTVTEAFRFSFEKRTREHEG